MFKTRQQAGKLLGIAVAEVLTKTPETRPIRTVVVGLARGGVIVAKEVASILCAPLSLLVAKHINSPNAADLVIAAVTSRGILVVSDHFDESIEGLPSYVRNQQMQLSRLSKTLEEHWMEQAQCVMPPINGKRLVLVSDCTVTGMNELAALKAFKQDRPAQVILATPVISEQAKYRLEAECTMVVTLQMPASLGGAMQFYEEFNHVEDDDIVASLKAGNRHGTGSAATP